MSIIMSFRLVFLEFEVPTTRVETSRFTHRRRSLVDISVLFMWIIYALHLS